MGMHAARKAFEIARNTENVLAVELICACQSLDLRAPIEPSHVTRNVLNRVREEIEFWDQDRVMYKDVEKSSKLINSGALIELVENILESPLK